MGRAPHWLQCLQLEGQPQVCSPGELHLDGAGKWVLVVLLHCLRLMQPEFLQYGLEAVDLCEAYGTQTTPVGLEWARPQSLLPLEGDPPMKHLVKLASEDDQYL